MGFSNPESGCRRHPNQRQLPGVCSFCLRERLSRLSSENNSYKTSSSSFSDSSSASSSPPSRRHHHHRRNGSAAAAPVGFVVHHGAASYHHNNNNRNGNGVGDVGVGSSGLKKSRSVAWAPTSFRMLNRYGNVNGKEDEKDKDEKSGKKGLWKKLVHSTSKKTKGVLMHSMTIKERSHNGRTNSSYHRF